MNMDQIFHPFQTLTKRMARSQKGRSLVTVAAIFMTTLMFTTLFTLAQSQSKNLIKMTFRQVGYDAQASIPSITAAQAAQLAGHPDVKEIGEGMVAGFAQDKKLLGRQVEIRWGSDCYASHSFSHPTTGRMPEAPSEIALDTITLGRLGIPCELGQAVTLEWQRDAEDAVAETATFTLCGFWEGNESSYASMAWVSREFAEAAVGDADAHVVQVALYSDRRIGEAMDKILADTGLDSLEYDVNLAYSPEMYASAAGESIPMYLGMFLVFVSGYLIIYNIFQIGVAADIQFYGKLKTLGATERQLKKLIYGQANRLCLRGVPAGLILGWLLGSCLVPVLMGAMQDDAVVSTDPVIFIGSALFAWLTVLVSCLRPARLAGKISPIEALRACEASPSGKRRRQTRLPWQNREGASLAGMAWANLGRNKKRTVMVICSLALGMILLSCYYAKEKAFDIEKYLEELTISDFTLSDTTDSDYVDGYNPKGTTLGDALVGQVKGLEGLEKVGYLYSHQTILNLDQKTIQNLNSFYTEERLSDWASYDSNGAEAFRRAVTGKQAGAVIYGLEGIPLETISQEQYLLDGSFDAERFSSGDYVLAVGPAVEREIKYPALPTTPVGDAVTIEGRAYTVMAVVYPLQPVVRGAYESHTESGFFLDYILPYSAFREQWPDNSIRKLFFNVDSKHLASARRSLGSLPLVCRQDMVEQYKAETRSDAVIGNAVSIVIALVGVLNFANSMITSIVSRRREFAMIQSVGMTKKQLCRMLLYEGFYYAGITAVVSVAGSALAVGVGVRWMAQGGFTTFRFTLAPLAVCIPAILAFAALIPYLCFCNLERQSLVERLRAE